MDLPLHKPVNIPIDGINLQGDLFIPSKCVAMIIFSHGSGSSRYSPRNKQVAEYLHKKNFGTLLFDLLTEQEDQYYQNRFNIDLLTGRLVGAIRWLETLTETKNKSLGLFGASTGAASALQAAARLSEVGAIVSRGGRPDLASIDDLPKVEAPTLLIVGSLDDDVLQLNKLAYLQMKCDKKIELVYGATHLFEEPGKMEIVAELAGNWFEKHLTAVRVPG